MESKTSRTLLLPVLGLVAIILALLFGSGYFKKSGTSGASNNLHCAMSKLWSDHVFWTRLYIISALDNKPDLKVTTERLLQNQKDIGAAVASYYGNDAGNKLAELLKEHIFVAAKVVEAAKSGNQDALKTEDANWHKNADELAQFLNQANPQHWGLQEMKDMLYHHLKLTTQEVVDRLNQQWDNDVKTFDQIYAQALQMGQGLADGIIAQFPKKF